MANSWKDLPAETLCSIASFIGGSLQNKSVRQCVLVCKTWNAAVNHQLYKKVYIDTFSNLLKFNRTIMENEDIANIVKSVTLFMRAKEESEFNACVYTLLCNLPNLQHFSSRHAPCFIAITNALLESKLTNLRTVGELDNIQLSDSYINCISHLKNRLQNVYIGDERATSSQLCNKLDLDQFDKLEEICIEKLFQNPVDEIDAIIEKCSTLREVKVLFLEDWDGRPTPIEIDEKIIPLLYTPRSQVQSLQIKREQSTTNQSLLTYIMHKFPNLKSLEFNVGNVDVMDYGTFQRLITFMINIKDLSLMTITSNIDFICDGIGSYWEATRSRHGNHSVYLTIEANPQSTNKASFILKDHENTTILLPPSAHDHQLHFFEKYGEHVGCLEISEFSRESMIGTSMGENVTILEQLITSIILCTHLRGITFNNCYINPSERSIASKKDCLLMLTFSNCVIGSHAFDTFFGNIRQIDDLTLEYCQFLNKDDGAKPSFCINMPNTIVESLNVDGIECSSYEPSYIFVSISRLAKESAERVQTFYYYDYQTHDDFYFKECSKEEYDDENHSLCIHINISCQSVTSLALFHEEHTVHWECP